MRTPWILHAAIVASPAPWRASPPHGRARKRAVSYLRVSSSGQVNTDYDQEGISLPAQREAVAGRSATTTDGRPEFQRMMARIKAEKDVDYIIVFARSRLHRNTIDSAITKRDLRKAGVILISVMDYTEDTAIGDLVATVLDGVNEYLSRAAGGPESETRRLSWQSPHRIPDLGSRVVPIGV